MHSGVASEHDVQAPPGAPHAVCVLGHVQAPSEHTAFDPPLIVQSVQISLFPHAVGVLGHAVGVGHAVDVGHVVGVLGHAVGVGHVVGVLGHAVGVGHVVGGHTPLIHSEAPLASSQC